GKPLVQHVVDQVKQCKYVDRVIVAADDSKIVDALRPFETEVVLTRTDHRSGTDRLAEVASKLDADLIINVQGDEPEIDPETIDCLISGRMIGSRDRMGTVATEFAEGLDPRDPNLVKVVIDKNFHAIYFSRSMIPYNRDNPAETSGCLLHVGLYAYRRDFLLEFAKLEPTRLERLENLEQLRALEHGVKIGVVLAKHATHGIDTPQQYDRFVERYLKRVGGRQSAVGGENRASASHRSASLRACALERQEASAFDAAAPTADCRLPTPQ
ncbi:MAG TPA: 3-deoxy-manno-octulosonate cytidylyltransferase, partial [Tepidisphaeraceae bacterium]|nr:3-deoxy-manno-octulosonate cytidylyltransferase [Tepidisphaeraceae bacterium]